MDLTGICIAINLLLRCELFVVATAVGAARWAAKRCAVTARYHATANGLAPATLLQVTVTLRDATLGATRAFLAATDARAA